MANKKNFVKVKKIWKKVFSKEEIKTIWALFIEASPFTKEEWKGKSLYKGFKEAGQFIHPETDKYDDTVGVQPHQMKWLLEAREPKEILDFFNFLNYTVDSEFLSRFIEDGFINWEIILELFSGELEGERSINFIKGRFSINRSSLSPLLSIFDKEVVEAIGEDKDILENVKILLDINPPADKKITVDYINPENFFEKRRTLWKKAKGFSPRAEEILFANPNNFDKKLLPLIEKIWGSKQIGELEQSDRKKVRILIDSLGINALALSPDFLKSEFKKVSNLRYKAADLKDLRPILNKFKEGFTSLQSAVDIIYLLNMSQNIREAIKNKDSLTERDSKILFFISQIFNRIDDDKTKEFLSKMTWEFWRVLFRYGTRDHREFSRLAEVYENRAEKCSIPNIKGKSGEYTYELIKKDNPIGLTLGYATDCCQVIGLDGESCLRRGYDKENSTFFVVMKKGRVYAQSWVWTKETNNGNKVLCFDSIEVLGKNLDKSKDILSAYKEVSEQLIESGYDLVFAGGDGNSIPQGMDKLGEYKELDFIEDNDLTLPFYNTYTDAAEEIYVIKGDI